MVRSRLPSPFWTEPIGETGALGLSKTPSSRHLDSDGVDEPAWERELERCYPTVFRGLLAVAGSREQAEDAMQEAVVAILQQGPGDVRRLDAWLYVVGLRALGRSRWKQRLMAPLHLMAASAPAPGVERVHVLELLGRL